VYVKETKNIDINENTIFTLSRLCHKQDKDALKLQIKLFMEKVAKTQSIPQWIIALEELYSKFEIKQSKPVPVTENEEVA